jgi:hypothetical protein
MMHFVLYFSGVLTPRLLAAKSPMYIDGWILMAGGGVGDDWW